MELAASRMTSRTNFGWDSIGVAAVDVVGLGAHALRHETVEWAALFFPDS